MVGQLPSPTEAVVSRHPRLSIDTSLVLRLDIPADFGEAAADTHARAILVGWYVEVGLVVLGQEGGEQMSRVRGEDFLVEGRACYLRVGKYTFSSRLKRWLAMDSPDLSYLPTAFSAQIQRRRRLLSSGLSS